MWLFHTGLIGKCVAGTRKSLPPLFFKNITTNQNQGNLRSEPWTFGNRHKSHQFCVLTQVERQLCLLRLSCGHSDYVNASWGLRTMTKKEKHTNKQTKTS